MPIPKEILAVKRPKNTIVVAYGKNKDRYAVRQRVGCRYENGRHLPVNGPTIGHIIDYQYVPISDAESSGISDAPADMKDWANVVLCDRLFKSIQDELFAVYSRQDALKLYCIAVLRACYPGIRDYELQEAYDASFLSELYPDVALSKNTVSAFLSDLGRSASSIVRFMRSRTAAVGVDHHLLVDRTLKSDESSISSLSDFSRKAEARGTRDIPVLYAFDLEAMEPVCSRCFPGKMPDLASYEAFISENGITRGIIAADRGFPSSAAQQQFRDHPDLHYLNPIRLNSKLIDCHHMLDFTGILEGFEGITFRKEKCSGTGRWLYSFHDSIKAAKEERDWMQCAKKEGTYSLEELGKKQEEFGTVVLECDMDLSPETVYKAYSQRWEIELVMRYYKSACEFDETRVQDDYSVIGSEFCDFLSAVLTFRLISAFDKKEILERMTYKEAMSILSRARKVKLDGESWKLIRINLSQKKILQELGLLESPEPAPKRRRGRPKKSEV